MELKTFKGRLFFPNFYDIKAENAVYSYECSHVDCVYNSGGFIVTDNDYLPEFGFCLNLNKNIKINNGLCVSIIKKGGVDYLEKVFVENYKIGDIVEIPLNLVDSRATRYTKENLTKVKIEKIGKNFCIVQRTINSKRIKIRTSIAFWDILHPELINRFELVKKYYEYYEL